MKDFMAGVGAMIAVFAILGLLGIGDFHLIMSDQKYVCTKVGGGS